MSVEAFPAIDMALARASAYRWFSNMFRQPSSTLSPEALGQALTRLPGFDRAMIPRLEESQLASEYRQLFSHNLTPDCPPYETQYGSTHIFWQSQQLADIAGFYRAFGLELSQEAHERLDHIAVELEFMSYLAFKEAYALERREDEHATIVQDAQCKFLKEHLGRWAGAFSSRVQAKLPKSAYASLTDLLARYVEWDCQRLGIQPELLSFSEKAQRQESVEGCFPCGGPGGPACA